MIRATIIAILMLGSLAFAEADIPAARTLADKAIAENDAMKAQVASIQRLYLGSLDEAVRRRESHEAELKAKDAEIAKRDAIISDERERKGRWPAYAQIALGGVLMAVASVVFIFGEPRSGLRLFVAGLILSSLGYGMLLLGFWYAVGGLIFALVCVAGVVTWEIRSKQKYRVSSVEVIAGLEEAIKVGEVTMSPALRAIMDAAQSTHTKKLVDRVTKIKTPTVAL